MVVVTQAKEGKLHYFCCVHKSADIQRLLPITFCSENKKQSFLDWKKVNTPCGVYNSEEQRMEEASRQNCFSRCFCQKLIKKYWWIEIKQPFRIALHQFCGQRRAYSMGKLCLHKNQTTNSPSEWCMAVKNTKWERQPRSLGFKKQSYLKNKMTMTLFF